MRGNGRGSTEALPSGSVRATWYAPDGTKQRRTFKDQDDADDWLAEQRIAVKRALWQPDKPEAPTLADYAARWIVERRNRKGQPLKPRTIHDYQRMMTRDLSTLGAMRLDAIRPADVRSWYVRLDDRPTLQANAYLLLAAIFKTAVDDGIVERTPCRIQGGGVKDRATRTVTLSGQEVHDLALAMPEPLRALIYVAAWDGLRMGEAFELRRADVAADGSAVAIARGVSWTPGETHVGTPKSDAGARTVATPPHVAAALVEHLRLWTGLQPDALLFTSSVGNRLRPSTLYRHFYRARKAIGREDLRFHDLRHTGATLAAQAGATLAELQSRLGHATVSAAMRYQHATSERDRLLAERISEAADPRTRLRAVE